MINRTLSGIADAENAIERRLVQTVSNAGVSLLTASVLEQPVALQRPNVEGEETLMYHAVVSDERLPWAIGSP